VVSVLDSSATATPTRIREGRDGLLQTMTSTKTVTQDRRPTSAKPSNNGARKQSAGAGKGKGAAKASRRQLKQPRYATANELVALVVCGGLAGILMLTTLIEVFPFAVAATDAKPGVLRIPLLFGAFHVTVAPDTALLLLVVFSSAVGGFVHVATSFANYAGRGRLETSWLSWYALRCLIGAALATVFYFVLRAGFFSGDATNSSVNVYGIAAVAGFVGLFSRQATDKLREVFDTLFKTDRSEEEVDPVISDIAPPQVPAGQVADVIISGSGFVRLSEVRIDGHIVTPSSIGPNRMVARVEAERLRQQGAVEVTIVNPGPCAHSAPHQLKVGPPTVDPTLARHGNETDQPPPLSRA
jgi:hypothetical protein